MSATSPASTTSPNKNRLDHSVRSDRCFTRLEYAKLEARRVLSVTGSFNSGSGILTIVMSDPGDALSLSEQGGLVEINGSTDLDPFTSGTQTANLVDVQEIRILGDSTDLNQHVTLEGDYSKTSATSLESLLISNVQSVTLDGTYHFQNDVTISILDSGDFSDGISGEFYVGGDTLIDVEDGSIELNNSNNDFVGQVEFQAGGTGDIFVSDANDILIDLLDANGDASITVQGNIQDTSTADIFVAGDLELTASDGIINGNNTITLGNSSFDNLVATRLNIVDAEDASLEFDNHLELYGTNQAESLLLEVSGDLTDSAATTLSTSILADLTADSITLGDMAGDSYTLPNLTVNSLSDASIQKLNGAVTLVGDSLAAEFTLSGFSTLGNASVSSVSVNGLHLDGGSVTLGTALGDTISSSDLSFKLSGDLVLESDSSLQLVAINSATNVQIDALGTLTNDQDAKLTVSNRTSLGGTQITLGDQTGDSFSFNILELYASTDVHIEADSAVVLGDVSATDFYLTSTSTITNESGALLAVSGTADLSATSITLGDQAGDSISFGKLTFNTSGHTTIEAESNVVLVGDSSADSLMIGTVGSISNTGTSTLAVASKTDLSANSITLGQNAGDDISLDYLQFTSIGDTTIDVTSDLTIYGTSSADNLQLSSTGKITDTATTDLNVASDAVFIGFTVSLGATGGTFSSQRLNFGSSNTVDITSTTDIRLFGGNANSTVKLTSSKSITNEASAALEVFGSLTLIADSIDVGNQAGDNIQSGELTISSNGTATYSENSGIVLAGDSKASDLTLSSTGVLTNLDSATLSVTGHANLQAASIDLGQASGDSIDLNTLQFNSTGSTIIESDQAITLTGSSAASDVTLTANGLLTNAASASVFISGEADLTATDIDLGNQATDIFKFSVLSTDTTGKANLNLDADVSLNQVTSAGDFDLTSNGTITNETNASISIAGLTTLSGNSIDLGSQVGDDIQVKNLQFTSLSDVSIDADSSIVLVGANTGDDVSLSAAGDLTTGSFTTLTATNSLSLAGDNIQIDGSTSSSFSSKSLTVQSTGNVELETTSDILFENSSSADDLSIKTTGSISNLASSSLSVTNLAKLTAANINLGNAASDNVTINKLTFSTSGSSDFALDGSVSLLGASTAQSLTLHSTGAVDQESFASLNVGTITNLAGTSISIGETLGSSFLTTDLQFQSTGDVYIASGTSVNLTGTNTAQNLVLVASGSITDSIATSLNVGQTAFFDATGNVILGDDAADTTNFGSFGASAFDVQFSEDSATHFDGIIANSLTVTSAGTVTQSGNDTGAGTNAIVTTGNFTINVSSGNDVLLNRSSSLGGMFNDGPQIDNNIAGVSTFNGADADLRFRNLNASLNGGIVLGSNYDNLELSLPNASFILNSMNIANDLIIEVGVAINDSFGTLVDVGGNATFDAFQINLGDDAFDLLTVTGTASFSGLVGVNVGSGSGSFSSGKLNFNSSGVTSITAQGQIELTGSNFGVLTTLSSTGALLDDATSSLVITGRLDTSASSIKLGDDFAQTVQIANFSAVSAGAVDLGLSADMTFVGFNTMDSLTLTGASVYSDNAFIAVTNQLSFAGDNLSLGFAAGDILFADTFNFSTAKDISINSFSDIVLVGSSVVDNLTLSAMGDIIGSSGAFVSVLESLSLDAGGGSFDVDFGRVGFVLFTSQSKSDLSATTSIYADNALIISKGDLNLGDVDVYGTLYVRTEGIPDGPGGRFAQGNIYQVPGSYIYATFAGFDATGTIQLVNSSILIGAFVSQSDDTLLPGVGVSYLNPVFEQALLGDRFGVVVNNYGYLYLDAVQDPFGRGFSVEGIQAEQGHIYVETEGYGSLGLFSDVRLTDSSQTITAIAAYTLDLWYGAQFIRGNAATVSTTYIPLTVNSNDTEVLTVNLLEGVQKLSFNYGIAGDGNYSVRVTWADGTIDTLSAAQLNALTSNPSDPGNANPVGDDPIVISKSTPYSTQALFELGLLESVIQVFNDPGIRMYEWSGSSDLNVASVIFEAVVGRDRVSIPNREQSSGGKVHVREAIESTTTQVNSNNSNVRAEFEINSSSQNEETSTLFSVHITEDGEENRIDWSGLFSISEVDAIKAKILEDGLSTPGEYSIRRTTADGTTIELLNFVKMLSAESDRNSTGPDRIAFDNSPQGGDGSDPTGGAETDSGVQSFGPSIQWVSNQDRQRFLGIDPQIESLSESRDNESQDDKNEIEKTVPKDRAEESTEEQQVVPFDPTDETAQDQNQEGPRRAAAAALGLSLLTLRHKREAKKSAKKWKFFGRGRQIQSPRPDGLSEAIEQTSFDKKSRRLRRSTPN